MFQPTSVPKYIDKEGGTMLRDIINEYMPMDNTKV